MPLATLTRMRKPRIGGAIFVCTVCEGWLLGNGFQASPFQVHHRASASLVVCGGCGKVRPIMYGGEAIPVSVGRWPDLPTGLS
jgi:hypothetical protein